MQRTRQMMVVNDVIVLIRPEHDRDHVLAEQFGALLFRLVLPPALRFSLTSRSPTVIWVGRSDRIGTGWRIGSRVLAMVSPFCLISCPDPQNCPGTELSMSWWRERSHGRDRI